MGQPARVIDLDAVRAKRSPPKRTPAPVVPMVWVPVLVWVPVWTGA